MSFFVSGAPQTQWGRLTDNTETTVFTARSRTTILSMHFKHSETSGTPALSILRNDGTNDFYFRNAEAIGEAKGTVEVDEVFVLDPGDTIKAQSDDASGDFHYRITYIASSASVAGNHH